jgi:hypothetical protein
MKPMSTYRKVRDGLEHSVMQLIIQLRREAKAD